MPLSAPVVFNNLDNEQRFIQCGATAAWQVVVDAGGLSAAADVTDPPNPTGMITTATRRIIQRQAKRGKTLRIRMGYGAGTITTQPIIQVFGRTGTNAWQAMANAAGSQTCTFNATPATDTTDGTNLYSQAMTTTFQWDCDGCDEFLIGVRTPAAGTAAASAFLEAKII